MPHPLQLLTYLPILSSTIAARSLPSPEWSYRLTGNLGTEENPGSSQIALPSTFLSSLLNFRGKLLQVIALLKYLLTTEEVTQDGILKHPEDHVF